MKYFFSSFIIVFSFLVIFSGCRGHNTLNINNNSLSTENYYITFHTSMGNIIVKLYNETPLHRDNFINLTKDGFYNGHIFHRVIKNFMIQSGDPTFIKAKKAQLLKNGVPVYTIPAEIKSFLFHKKGALAAARTGDFVNPERVSSASQFYIVQGKKFSDIELDQIEKKINQANRNNIYYYFHKKISTNLNTSKNIDPKNINQEAIIEATDSLDQYIPFHFTSTQRNTYKTIGGAPHLDGAYTVFGEVVSGQDIVDKIASVPTDTNNKPLQDVKILNVKITRK